MITKSDWRAVNQQLMADDRRRLGEPPTTEEMLAYTRGELTAEEEARVRERLVCHPDLVRTLTEPFPTEGAEAGDADYLPDEEFASHWSEMQTRMGRGRPAEGARVLPFWRFSAALAAMLAVVFGALLWQARSKVPEPQVVLDQQVLFPDGRRGGNADAGRLTAQGDPVLLVIPLIGQRGHERYRLELVNADSGRSIWQSAALRPREDDAFAIVMPRRLLEPGTYQIIVHGSTTTGEERLASYSLRVPAR
jgi:hypothetical protein